MHRSFLVLAVLSSLAGCDGLPWQKGDVPPILDEDPCDEPDAWFLDNDDDGFGDPATRRDSCAELAGWSRESGDCDDHDAGTYPGAIEVCDGVDRDCDGRIDADAVDAGSWYVDGDGDGFGVGEPVASCEPVDGRGPAGGDCDDLDAAVHPGAEDAACDGIDQDCDGTPVDDPVQVGGATWPSVQAALDAAPAAPVWVCEAGAHAVALFQEGGSVDLRGGLAPGEVVLVPARVGRVLDIADAERVQVEDLVLADGFAEGDGGAARISAGSIEFVRVGLRDNQASGDGGALWLQALDPGQVVRLTQVGASENVAGGDGGAIALFADGAGVYLELETMGNHGGGDGGAVVVERPGLVTLSLTASEDRADGDGGAVAIRGADLQIDANVEVTSTRAGGSGGALSAIGTGFVDLVNRGTVEGAVADVDGGALHVIGDGVLLPSPGVVVQGCSAGRDGGGLAVIAGAGGFDVRTGSVGSSAGGRGGAVFATVDAGASTLWADLLQANSASEGGAVYVQGQREGTPKARLKLSLTDLTDNRADRGAAVLVTRAGVAESLMSVSARSLLDNLGGTAFVIEGATGGTARTRHLDGNSGGGVRVPDTVDLRVTGHLGDVDGNNGPYDIWWGGAELDVTNPEEVYVRCRPGSGCTTEI